MTLKLPKARFFLIFVFAFAVGAGVDAYLRTNKGPTCFGCSTYFCVIVELADHPSLILGRARDGFRSSLF